MARTRHPFAAPARRRRTVEEHQAVVAELVAPAPAEWVVLAEALGRVLAEDVTAPIPLPPFDNAAMDGYAVRAADVAAATGERPVLLPVVDDIPAGRTDIPVLAPGTAHRIMTGAPLPTGADAVVPVEQTDGGSDRVAFRAAVAAGNAVRRAGEDVTEGAVVLTAGTVLGPAQIGAAAAVGLARVPVRRRPVVLVLSTGSELVEPGSPLKPGQIYESNGAMLTAAVTEAGGVARHLRFVPDDVDRFLAELDGHLAADGIDLVLTSGGVSAGAYEVVREALSERGVEFVKVAMQPGGPQGAGRLSGPDVPVVALPGNPVSALVSFEVFVRPALRAALGHRHLHRPVVRATLVEQLESPAGLRQFRRGVIDTVRKTVREVGGPGSHLIAALARSECLIVLPEEVTTVDAGSTVEVWLLDG